MKKLLLLILACGSPALAAINVTEGSGKTVRTVTSGGQEVQGVFLTDGISSVTVTSAGSLLVTSTNTSAIFLASGTATSPFYFNPASTLSTVSTNTVITVAVQLASGTATNPFIVTVPVAVQLSSGGPNNPLNVGVVNIATVTHNGVPQPIFSTMTVPAGVLVSSTSFLQAFTQGTTVAMMADSQGRLITADIPDEIKISTYNAALGGDTVEHVLISSATGSQRIRMCGCMLMNASATNTGYTIYASTSNNISRVAGARAFPIGSPANYIPSGVRADCGRPFFVGDQGGQITYKASATQTAALTCTYYSQ